MMPSPPKYVLQGHFDVPPEKWDAANGESLFRRLARVEQSHGRSFQGRVRPTV